MVALRGRFFLGADTCPGVLQVGRCDHAGAAQSGQVAAVDGVVSRSTNDRESASSEFMAGATWVGLMRSKRGRPEKSSKGLSVMLGQVLK